MITAITFVTAFVVITLLAFAYFRLPSKAPTVPGLQPVDSKGNGNLPDIKAAGSLHEFLVKLHTQFGPIASFWFGPTFTVSVASPDILQELKRVFDRPPQLFRPFEPLIGSDSVQYCNGIEGKTRRKTTSPAFSHAMLPKFCETLNKLAEEAAGKLASLPKDEHIPICQTTLSLAIKGLSQTSFGTYFSNDDMCHKLQHNYEVCIEEITLQMEGNIPEANSERQKSFTESLETIHNMIKDIIKLRRQNPPKPDEKVFIDILMGQDDIFSEKKILDDALTYMIAGFHTTGHLLAWALYFLAKHKDVQERACQEVISVIGKDKIIGPEAVGELPYIRKILNESLRLSALAPIAARVHDVDANLGGYVIPKGIPVITALGVVYQDAAIWPMPSKFDPERFSEENVRQRHPYSFQPFGLPGRVCPGCRFAMYKMTVFLAVLVRNFKWSLAEGNDDVERMHSIVTLPKDEIWAIIEKRK